MSIPMQRMGDRAFRRGDDDDVEREYDRLRDLARAEAKKRNSCFDRSQQAYKSGDGAGAKQLSNQGKAHDAKMDDYNRQASEYIFRENNAPGRIDEDEIDLHGQFVEEAEKILEQRIRSDQQRGIVHLYAIVGKGHHSTGGVQKIKPKVEELCQELGLRYHTDEENEGRIFINLQGGEPQPKPSYGGYQQHHGGYQQGQHGYSGGHQQPHHGQQQQHHGQQQQQQQGGQDELEQAVKKNLPRILKAFEKHCCVVM
ncbi:smr domain-containing protein [Sarocladium implicatum]|nr:smr domain-containing protein [Sarocladium implicatum]